MASYHHDPEATEVLLLEFFDKAHRNLSDTSTKIPTDSLIHEMAAELYDAIEPDSLSASWCTFDEKINNVCIKMSTVSLHNPGRLEIVDEIAGIITSTIYKSFGKSRYTQSIVATMDIHNIQTITKLLKGTIILKAHQVLAQRKDTLNQEFQDFSSKKNHKSFCRIGDMTQAELNFKNLELQRKQTLLDNDQVLVNEMMAPISGLLAH